jgi:Leucine-rich repeat (LRR) protein
MSKATLVSIFAALFILFLASQVGEQPEESTVPAGESETATESAVDAEAMPLATNSGRVEVYDGISVPSNTKTLDLSDRGLTGSLKAEVRMLPALEVLDVSGNQFTGLPAEVGQLSNLRILNLSNNPLTGLPLELGNLQNLEQLDVRNTNYSQQDLSQIEAALPRSTVILK